MASAQKKYQFEGKNDTQVFNAALQAIPQAGLKIWKTRDLARLVLAQGNVEGKEVHCNIAISMVDGSTTISAEAKDLDAEKLDELILKLKSQLDIALG